MSAPSAPKDDHSSYDNHKAALPNHFAGKKSVMSKVRKEGNHRIQYNSPEVTKDQNKLQEKLLTGEKVRQ